MTDVGDWVNRQGEAGEFKNTHEFSVNAESGLQKLSQFQLPRPELWIVKMVQAAVAAGASEIDIRMAYRRVTVRFDCQRGHLASQMLHHVLSGALPSEASEQHLVVGLRASLSEGGSKFELKSLGPDGHEKVGGTVEHSELERDPDKTHETYQLSFSVSRKSRSRSLKKNLRMSVFQLMKRTAAEHFALLTHCWCCPIPIKLDGRYMDTRYDSPLQYYGERLVGREVIRFCLALRDIPLQGSELSLPSHRNLKPSRFHKRLTHGPNKVLIHRPILGDGRFLDWTPQQERCAGVVALMANVRRNSMLFFVCDGAVVQRAPLRLKPRPKMLGMEVPEINRSGLRCCQPVSIGELDLSGFSVRDAESKRDLFLESNADLFQDTEMVVTDNLDRLGLIPGPPIASKLVGGAFGSAYALMAGSMVFTHPWMLVPMALACAGQASLGLGGTFAASRTMVRLGMKAVRDIGEEDVEQPDVDA